MQTRYWLLLETAIFAAASIFHSGVLLANYYHKAAGTAELTIAVVLLIGTVLAWVRPAWTRGAALAAQGFALLGTLVGATLIAIGVGPRSGPDIVIHAIMLVVLIWGLFRTVRGRSDATAEAWSS